MPAFRLILASAWLSATLNGSAAAQDWSRYDEALNVLALSDVELYPDVTLLERIRDGLERSREAFPELRPIQSCGPGATLSVVLSLLPDSVRNLIARQVQPQRVTADGTWAVIERTGFRTLDSLNDTFGAARILAPVDSATGTLWPTGYLRLQFTRPMNIARLEKIYDDAGVLTGELLYDIMTFYHPRVRWESAPGADLLRFELDSDCRDSCHRYESYVVRVPIQSGPVKMVSKAVVVYPDH